MKCPYCKKEAKWRPTSAHIYGRNFGPVYECEPCDARVSCHRRAPKTPLGTLANAELRHWRQEAHDHFDEIWQRGQVSRKNAYRQLAKHFGEREVHIGESDVERCRKIIDYALSVMTAAR